MFLDHEYSEPMSSATAYTLRSRQLGVQKGIVGNFAAMAAALDSIPDSEARRIAMKNLDEAKANFAELKR